MAIIPKEIMECVKRSIPDINDDVNFKWCALLNRSGNMEQICIKFVYDSYTASENDTSCNNCDFLRSFSSAECFNDFLIKEYALAKQKNVILSNNTISIDILNRKAIKLISYLLRKAQSFCYLTFKKETLNDILCALENSYNKNNNDEELLAILLEFQKYYKE